jgi:GrpB-like predicted nucleotidyltransferase (UPF0157 family)
MIRVVIAPYSERWPGDFARLGRRLRAVLGDGALRIDHIGSTAVPGLDAKDRIDVQVVVADLDVANPLGGAGFIELAPASDHQPPGGVAAADDWRKRFFQAPADERAANVHVRLDGRPNARYALLFRDYLRTHPGAAGAYADLKRRLAAELRAIGPYTDIKDAACDLVIVAAEEWAAATDWDPGASDA